MSRPWTARDSWRVKVAAAWACAAPVGAMVLVMAGGGSSLHGQLVVSGQSLPPGEFIDVPAELPAYGADGQLPVVAAEQVDVPETGSSDGQAQPPAGATGDVAGIPGTVLAAYQKAAGDLAVAMPGCRLTWPLLAGIGKVESSHASGGRVDAQGNTRGRILGPVLNGGPGMAAIADTDQGVYDGNTTWDRAVGPMQFIPGTWATFGADGNGDGVRDPHNVFDAARASGDYLCQGGADLSNPQQLVQAVLQYNHSMDYVSTVLRWMQAYSRQTVTIPDSNDVIPPADDTTGNTHTTDDRYRPTTPPSLPTPLPTPGATTTTPTTPPTVILPTPTHTTQLPIRPTAPTTTRPPYDPPRTTRPTAPPSTPPTTPPTTPPDTPTPTPDVTPTPTPNPTTPPETTTPTPPDTPTPDAPTSPGGTP